MNWDAIGAIGEVLGSVAVLLTLIYLAIQIKQNTNALNAESRRAALDGGHAELFAIVENPKIVSSIVNPEPLTEEEQISLSAYLFAAMRTREFAWGQFKQGAIDGSQWATEVNVIRFILDSQRTRLWWKKLGYGTFSPDFALFVDDLIRESSPTDTLWQSYVSWSQGNSD